MLWDQERTEQIVKDWNDGLSAGIIAKKLGRVTRNAVIGKIHRIAADSKSPYAITRKVGRSESPLTRLYGKGRKRYTPTAEEAEIDRQLRAYPRRPRLVREALPPEPTRPARLVSFEDLTDKTCRFVYGDPKGKDWGYCDCEKVPGSSYCAGHHAKCFEAPMPRRRKNSVNPLAKYEAFGGCKVAQPARFNICTVSS